MSWAGCLPEDGAVVVVLTNQVFEDIGGMASRVEPDIDATNYGLRTVSPLVCARG